MPSYRCPRCTFTLVPLRPGGIDLDACPRCHGVFVEAGERGAFLGPWADVDSWPARGVGRSRGVGRLACPFGGPTATHGRMSLWDVALPAGGTVEVDVCRQCHGLWLDSGEARRLVDARGASSSSSAAAPVARLNEPPPGEEKTGLGWYLLQAFTAIPVEVYNPKRRVAVMCLLLIAACIGVFFVEIGALAGGDGDFLRRYGCVPADLLRGRNVVGAFTHMFLHGGIAHLVGNLWFLWTFGDNVEDRVGRLRFVGLYVLFGLVAVLTHAVLTPDPAMPLVGASGAISGLMGAYLALFPRAKFWQVILFLRLRLPVWFYVGGWALMNVASGIAEREGTLHAGVAWWAHVGGFVAGLVWGVFFGGPWRDGAETRAT